MSAWSEPVELIEHEYVVHACLGVGPGLSVNRLLHQRSHDEALEVPVGQAIDVNDQRQANVSSSAGDIQRMAFASIHSENARTLVHDPSQTTIEPPDGPGMVDAGERHKSGIAIAIEPVLKPVKELFESRDGRTGTKFPFRYSVVTAALVYQQSFYVRDEKSEVVVLAIAVAEQVCEQVPDEYVLQRPAVWVDVASTAHRDGKIGTPWPLRSEEFRPEWRWVDPADLFPCPEVILREIG